jgi:hypothetical protein
MRKVLIENVAQLNALNTQLYKSRYVQRCDPPAGHMIRTLKISKLRGGTPAPDEAKLRQAISTAISHALYLERYCLPDMPSTQLELVWLSNVACTTLSLLELTIPSDADDFFPMIQSFPRLTSLYLSFESGTWRHPVSQALQFPKLADLAWSCIESDDENMLTFLSKCSLAQKLNLQLDIPRLSASHADVLRPFLASHSIDDLVVALPAAALNVLAPEIMRIPAVEFYKFVPGPHVLASGKLPRTLSLPFREHARSQARFWEFLEALAELPQRPADEPTTVEIYIPKQTSEFDWLAEEHGKRTEFISRLVLLAERLRQRNITVHDKHRRDVTCLQENAQLE